MDRFASNAAWLYLEASPKLVAVFSLWWKCFLSWWGKLQLFVQGGSLVISHPQAAVVLGWTEAVAPFPDLAPPLGAVIIRAEIHRTAGSIHLFPHCHARSWACFCPHQACPHGSLSSPDSCAPLDFAQRYKRAFVCWLICTMHFSSGSSAPKWGVLHVTTIADVMCDGTAGSWSIASTQGAVLPSLIVPLPAVRVLQGQETLWLTHIWL